MNNSGMYGPANFDQHTPANVLGGINRAKTARRDSQGKFLATTETYRTSDPEHSVKAGKIRAAHAKRNEKGRFTK